MKIRSKYKDYYDYLIGIYGVDEKLYYDRTKLPFLKKSNIVFITNYDSIDIIKVYVVDKLYKIVRYKGDFLTSPEELLDFYENDRDLYDKHKGYSLGLPYLSDSISYGYNSKKEEYEKIKESRLDTLRRFIYNEKGEYDYDLGKIDLNTNLEEPVVVVYNGSNYIMNLSEINFNKILKPHDIYLEISNFLSNLISSKEKSGKMSDGEKILSHGFDIKKSFRHRK